MMVYKVQVEPRLYRCYSQVTHKLDLTRVACSWCSR